MAMTRISERRELLTFDSAYGGAAYIGMWVDGVQIAAGILGGFDKPGWSLWSSGLALRPEPTPAEAAVTFGQPPRGGGSHPLYCRTEADVRAWLDLLADLAEHGPRVVETRRMR